MSDVNWPAMAAAHVQKLERQKQGLKAALQRQADISRANYKSAETWRACAVEQHALIAEQMEILHKLTDNITRIAETTTTIAERVYEPAKPARCNWRWRAGVVVPPGSIEIPDGTRCSLPPHGEDVAHEFLPPKKKQA
jgi:hypothetical protein